MRKSPLRWLRMPISGKLQAFPPTASNLKSHLSAGQSTGTAGALAALAATGVTEVTVTE